MTFQSILHPAPVWTMEDVQDFLHRTPPEEYLLLDVRRPREYSAGHLPGALPVPLEELEERLRDFDAEKTMIVYGGSGLRSRAAAHVLVNAGFLRVRSIKGGIQGWQGKTAKGLPEENFTFFAQAASPLEQIILAWHLEEGTRRFYLEMAETVQDLEAVSLFRELISAEEHHKGTLQALYEGMAGQPTAPDFPAGLPPVADEQWMEGGLRVAEAIEWTQGRQIRDILDLAVSLETNAYDRYLLLRRKLADENSRRVFEILSDEERRHLQKLERLLDHFV